MFRQLGTNSVIFVITNVTQKAAMFLLMPLYTLFLDPAAFGVLAIVTAINGFLSIAFTLGLTGAVTRYYFEYRDQPAILAEFWGSILSVVMITSVVLGAVMLLAGQYLLAPFVGDVDFWPYVAIGVVTTVFQPYFLTILSVLQARNQAMRYAVLSLANFALTTALTVALVVFLRRGVVGALTATLVSAVIFLFVSAYLMRGEVRLCLRWAHLREALAYSVPLVPHSVASQLTAMSDRLIVNARLGTSFAGLYSVGAMVAMGIEVAAYGVNKAYYPLSMQAMKSRDSGELAQLRAIGALVVAGFSMLAAGVGIFAPEILWLLAAPAFAPAARVVPVLVFSGVASAIYYVLVNALFYERTATRLVPLGTLCGGASSVLLALTLVPWFGMLGAAVANLLSQVLATLAVALLARRFDPVRWDYGRYALAFAGGLACSLLGARLETVSPLLTILLKLCLLSVLALFMGAMLWRRPLILAEALWQVARRRTSEAAAMFRAL
jgi:O-antigen/teichoic acid export membrane protein